MRISSLALIVLLAGCGGGTTSNTLKLVGEKCSANTECASGTCNGTCAPWTFTQIDNQVFKISCEFSSCHSPSGARSAGMLDLQSGAYAALVGVPATNAKAKAEAKNRVTANDPTNSFLYIKLTIAPQMQAGMAVCNPASASELQSGYGGCMPQANPPLDPGQIDGIKSWIAMGAPNN